MNTSAPEHPQQNTVTIDEIILKYHQTIQTDKNHQTPNQIFVNNTDDVLLLRNTNQNHQHTKQTKHLNATTINNKNEITKDHHTKQTKIKHTISQLRNQTNKLTITNQHSKHTKHLNATTINNKNEITKDHHTKQTKIKPQYRDWETDRKSTRLNSSHEIPSRMPSSA